ncbi:hypothetical protein CKA55_07480 [Arcobacter suis]|uniref:Uncharacterized protein n=1 Tax=Arcobacter suis CECT 7833 TaxID=663365 RepID=A0AAD0WQI9_9BACT|nr:hypothetical protein [Arcobacter suis]AXX89337.1 hypothetical protein ASUIS_0846 [Arcobacter suis CECT 7833]RWS46571.1 hypothetical protein CKA55_07480 [Arcobacter suis]
MRVKFLTSLVGPNINYQTGVTEDIINNEGCSLIKNGVAEPADKKAKEIYALFLDDEKSKQEQKEEEERQAAAILEKDFLENKRANLQSEVDAITHILDDAVVYYKSYVDLLDDLNKQEPEKKEDEQNQGDEEK